MDAAMTCGAALERLAEHHAWFDESHPTMRALVAERAALLDFDEAVVWEGLRAAHLAPPAERPHLVVIRRAHLTTVYWYVRSVDELRDRLPTAPLDMRLGDWLGLHEYESEPTTELSELREGRASGMVVLEQGALVGVLLPMAAAAPPPPAPPEETVRGGPESRTIPAPAAGAPAGAPVPAPAGEPPPVAGAPAPAPTVVTAYPDLLAPQAVVAGVAFDLEVGLAAVPVAGVSGGALQLPAAPDQRAFDVEVRVTADGFDAPDGWTARFTTPVRDVTRGRTTIALVARAPDAPVGVGSLLVHFVVDGVLRGAAARAVVVLRDAAVPVPDVDPRGLARTDVPPTPAFRAAPGGGDADDATRADIEIVIAKPDRDPTSGRFSVLLRTPHPVPVPDALPDVNLGKDPQTFAKVVIDEMLRHDRTPFADLALRGIGKTVAQKLSREFWDAFGAVARHVRDALGRVPTVLLLASENLVPWELAALPEPLDPALPPYLGAQTNLGRWIYDAGAVPLPPATTIAVRRMAALAGHYAAESGLRPLPHAVEEARELSKRYGAIMQYASGEKLSALLDAALEDALLERGGAELVHFAGHGEVDPKTPGVGGLLLETGVPVHPLLFADTALGARHRPFLFLNACTVGSGGELLGDAGGFPGQCLGGGFRGMVAPLWAVRDTTAREVALAFYDAALGDDTRPPRPVGEVMREIRARYAASVQAQAPVPTYLAYVLYGHPALMLAR
jgi:hypothetical protein